MQIVTLQAHFDGRHILLDEPYELEPNTKLIVSVIDMKDEEREDWARLSIANLERTYGMDEPEYEIWNNTDDDVYAELLGSDNE